MSITLRAIEGTVHPDGRLETAEPLHLKRRTKVLITIAVNEEEDSDSNLTTVSETTWSRDWANTDEDEAWESLQEVK